MKYGALLFLLAVSLMGCPPEVDEAAIVTFDSWYDWKVQRVVKLIEQRNALPEGDPERARIDTQIAVERESLENTMVRALLRGVQYTTPDGQFQIKLVDGADYQLQARWVPVSNSGALAPVAVPLPAGRSNAADAPERFNTAPLATEGKGN